MQHRVEIHDIEPPFGKVAQIVSRADLKAEVRPPFLLRERDPQRQRVDPDNRTCRTDESDHILRQQTRATAHIEYLFPRRDGEFFNQYLPRLELVCGADLFVVVRKLLGIQSQTDGGHAFLPLAGNDRQEQMRRQAIVMEHRLLGWPDFRVSAQLMPGVLVAVIARKVTGRHFQPQAMTRLEDVAG